MSKRESNSVRLDKQGVPKVMHIFDYFADSLGMLSLNAISGPVGQLTYFYTDKVGAAAGAIATMFLICKIVDAFTDLIMRHICDSTKSGKEKYRPWLLRAGVPAGIMLVLLFMVPKGANQTIQLIYMCITNLLMTAILYTAISIPYGAIMMIRTPRLCVRNGDCNSGYSDYQCAWRRSECLDKNGSSFWGSDFD